FRMGIKPGAQERAQASKQALSKDSMPPGRLVAVQDASHIAAKRKQQWKEFGRAVLYMSPALLFLAAFTYIPFLRSVWLSFFVTNPQGATARFNGINYYTRILNLDGSGRNEYLKSILTTVYFAFLVVPLGIVFALGLALLATLKVKAISYFRTIFTSSIAISVASASVIWALIYSPTIRLTQWIIDIFNINANSLLQSSSTALLAVAFMTTWTTLGF